jgi:spore coat protein CotH
MVTATALALALTVAGCSAMPGAPEVTAQSAAFYGTDSVHSISVDLREEDYQAMIAAYEDTGAKDWISATVRIDGTTFENVGLRLKGNSSLRGLSGVRGAGPAGKEDTGAATATATATPTDAAAAEQEPGADTSAEVPEPGDGEADADSPETLPWLIRLDQFVDSQRYQGRTDFVIRGNNSESSLNEAVALELLGAAGLTTQKAAAVRFSVNGSDEDLRLVIENPDDELWNEDTFDAEGNTYEAKSGGDYSYRGTNPDAYNDVFEQKAGNDDLAPLTTFLDFINNSSDADFTAHLGEHLDVDAFATYLAMQELVGNFDDIDGPGNNSYLRYDAASGLMTVVSWDENLAFGGMGNMGEKTGQQPGQGSMPSRPEGMEPPEGMQLPEGMDRPQGMGGRFAGKENALSSRFARRRHIQNPL